MFWEFLFNSGYLPSPTPLASTPSTPSLQESSDPENSKPQILCKVQTPLVDLTAEDLHKAGYNNTKKPWTEEEDTILKKQYEINGKDWVQIAKLLPSRNDKMCYSRYQRLKYQTKNIWRKEENEKLLELVKEFGFQWKLISSSFKKRTAKQLKEHYMNYLRPEINKDEWSLEEDLKLVYYLNMHGKNWAILEQIFQNRTQSQIKNRYFGRLRKLSEKKLLQKEELPSL